MLKTSSNNVRGSPEYRTIGFEKLSLKNSKSNFCVNAVDSKKSIASCFIKYSVFTAPALMIE